THAMPQRGHAGPVVHSEHITALQFVQPRGLDAEKGFAQMAQPLPTLRSLAICFQKNKPMPTPTSTARPRKRITAAMNVPLDFIMARGPTTGPAGFRSRPGTRLRDPPP